MKFLLLLMPLMALSLTGCDSEEISEDVPERYYLELDFVDANGNPVVTHYDETGPEASQYIPGPASRYNYISDVTQTSNMSEIEGGFPDFVVAAVYDDGREYLTFMSRSKVHYMLPVINHKIHSAKLFGYKPDCAAELTTHWIYDRKVSGFICTSVTFEGKDCPLTIIGRPSERRATVTLPVN